ncbi:MAG: hypothetical protein V4714_05235 [Bacteroidota bacterium]
MKKLNRPPRITEIIKIDHFSLTTRWTTGEIRTIDFLSIFNQWDEDGDTIMMPIRDLYNFQQVMLHEGGTLAWPSVQRKGYQDNYYPVALDPDVLYKQSELVKESIVVIDFSREFTQKEYAKRQSVSQSVVRNWVNRGKVKTHYIPELDLTLVVE